ncbi:MAG: methylated-DNA--[protein]-cysteine S-methyltransferase [Planctomycetota bacterium]|nr:methylated-DNA--[protein]-cysteine S-methyltransferase [Planctomycetota bacterium]
MEHFRSGVLAAQFIETPLGTMIVAASDRGVRLVEFADPEPGRALETVAARTNAVMTPGPNEHTAAACAQLGEYFAGGRRAFDLPLDLAGSEFQLAVWGALLEIPFGQTLSYGALARNLGRAGSARAVGRANGLNPVAVVVPCHRVIQSDGALCGYGGGPWRKQWLLEHEGVRLAGAEHEAPLFAAR